MPLTVRIATVTTVVGLLCARLAGQIVDPPPRPPLDDHPGVVLDMLPGVVEPAKQVILAAPFDGILMRIHVRDGDFVTRGQAIAAMDSRVAQAAVKVAQQAAQSRVAIRLAQSELRAAQKYAVRVAKAQQSNAVSELELDRAQDAVEKAARMLERALEDRGAAQARLELEQARLAEHAVASPFEGRVIRVIAREGESLNRAEEIAEIANVRQLEVEMQVPLAWFRRLHVGQDCWLMASAPVNNFVAARLVMIEPHIDPATQTFRCRFEIDNRDAALPAGFTVRLAAPNSARQNNLTRKDPDDLTSS